MTLQDLRIRRVAIDTWRENVAYPAPRLPGRARRRLPGAVQGDGACQWSHDQRGAQRGRRRAHRPGLRAGPLRRRVRAPRVAEGHAALVTPAEPPASIAALHRKISGERLSRDDLFALITDVARRGIRRSSWPPSSWPPTATTSIATRCCSSDRSHDRRRPAPRLAAPCAAGRWSTSTASAAYRATAPRCWSCPSSPPTACCARRRQLARHHLAGRHRRHDGGAGRRRAAIRAAAADRARHQRLPGLGRHGRPVAGRRHPDLGRAAAGHRLAGADGGIDPVEEDRRRLHPPGARHPGGPDAPRCAAMPEAQRLRKLFEYVAGTWACSWTW
jgi:hypothetical protein